MFALNTYQDYWDYKREAVADSNRFPYSLDSLLDSLMDFAVRSVRKNEDV